MNDLKNNCLYQYELCRHLSPVENSIDRRCQECQTEIDDDFNNFWRELVCDEQGSLDAEKVKAELFDFHSLIGSVTKVYDSLTGGRLSKPHYAPEVVIAEVEDSFDEIIKAEKDLISAYLENYKNSLKTSVENYYLKRHLDNIISRIEENSHHKLSEKVEVRQSQDFNFCKNCRIISAISADFKCKNCGENICVICGCTDSKRCSNKLADQSFDFCCRTRSGVCSFCAEEKR